MITKTMIPEIKDIIIDPRFKVNYASFYLYGISKLIGENKLHYHCLDDILIETDKDSRIGFAMKIITESDEKRVYIDYGDWDEVNEKYYSWCDVYAKINVSQQDVTLKKLLIIGPSFGVKLWNPIKCVYMGFKHYWHIKKTCDTTFKRSMLQYIKDYGYLFIRRKSYSHYHRFAQEEKKGYVFSFNTLWYGDEADNTTNRLRGDFMLCAKQLMPQFDGGFYYIVASNVLEEWPPYIKYLEEYGDIIHKSRISMNEYDKRIRKSWFVFNTPSVARCHGWKLAEYLCEGKAIISTQLTNVMPVNFENDVHYIEANTKTEMSEAIVRLRDDEKLVQQLKQNAFNYFNQNLAPEVVVKRIINCAGIMI